MICIVHIIERKENKTNKQHLLLYKKDKIVVQNQVAFCLKLF